jgi:glycosyltransferase involved in cell wall biosynthesis
MKPLFIYALHSGKLYGTERMALHTLSGLRDDLSPVLFAPPGAALEQAQSLGIQTVAFNNPVEFALRLRPWLARPGKIGFAATALTHSMIFSAWNQLYRRHCVHLHVVHGGAEERESYGRKYLLNRMDVKLVAVSGFVRERLLAHGVKPGNIVVAENFLPIQQIRATPKRPLFTEAGVRSIIVVSRVEPIKRIALLLDALDRHPELCDLPIRIFGTGWDLETLRQRAQNSHTNIVFEGFSEQVAQHLAASDLFLHLCPVEPFGLAILEAMAANVPVLAADQGGAAEIIQADGSGFHFRSDDADDLARALLRLRETPAATLNQVTAAASQRLENQFSSAIGLKNYRQLFAEILNV